jgi:hypothetical protein
MIVSAYLQNRAKASGIKSHFWFVEFTDYLFHRYFCDLILSPFPLRTPTRHPKFHRIGLIVRRAVREAVAFQIPKDPPSPRQLRNVVFMLSGSVHASRIPFGQHPLPFSVQVVGRDGQSSGNVTFHGRKLNNTELLAKADALVINGGYSAVSEAFFLRKPVFVIPVPGHAEQFVNACLARDLGLGFIASENDVLGQLLEMYEQDRWIGRKPMPPEFETNGAEEAARLILGLKPLRDLEGARGTAEEKTRVNTI